MVSSGNFTLNVVAGLVGNDSMNSTSGRIQPKVISGLGTSRKNLFLHRATSYYNLMSSPR